MFYLFLINWLYFEFIQLLTEIFCSAMSMFSLHPSAFSFLTHTRSLYVVFLPLLSLVFVYCSYPMAFLWLSRPKPEPAGRNCLMCVRQAKYAGQKLCTPKHNYASVKGRVCTYVCVCACVLGCSVYLLACRWVLWAWLGLGLRLG